MATVNLPTQLSGLASGRKELNVDAATLADVFSKLDETAPMIRSQIFDATGTIRQFVGLFLDGRQVTDAGSFSMAIRHDSQVLIVMSVAGG